MTRRFHDDDVINAVCAWLFDWDLATDLDEEDLEYLVQIARDGRESGSYRELENYVFTLIATVGERLLDEWPWRQLELMDSAELAAAIIAELDDANEDKEQVHG